MPARHVYTLLVVMAGWVFFRTESIGEAMQFFNALAGQSAASGGAHALSQYLDVKVASLVIVGAVLATPLSAKINAALMAAARNRDRVFAGPKAAAYSLGNVVVLVSLFLLVLTAIASNAYNPFIYFRF